AVQNLHCGPRNPKLPKLPNEMPINIGLFGGTFDPIHLGHIALAHAARERFDLGRIYFVPANLPPHKQREPLAPFAHRYAMVVLATMGEKSFVPSLLEAPGVVGINTKSKSRSDDHAARPNYSIDTVRRLKQSLKKSDRLLFLIGIDGFDGIASWDWPGGLMLEGEFIVPIGAAYRLAVVADALFLKLHFATAEARPFSEHTTIRYVV